MKLNKTLAAVAIFAMTAVTAVQAAPIDVTAVVTDITATIVPIGLVGGAVLVVHLGLKAYRWVRSALA